MYQNRCDVIIFEGQSYKLLQQHSVNVVAFLEHTSGHHRLGSYSSLV